MALSFIPLSTPRETSPAEPPSATHAELGPESQLAVSIASSSETASASTIAVTFPAASIGIPRSGDITVV